MELARLTEKLGDYIKSNPGLRMEAIAKALATPTRELNLPIKKLLAAKKIRSTGQKRATEYFPL
jgi:predicted transcriptional regulator